MIYNFKAELDLIGVNPFVFVPDTILNELFIEAGKTKGHIPICITLKGKKHKQTLVRYSGSWRLYINTNMLKNSPKHIGEIIEISIEFDPSDRTILSHPKLIEALDQNLEAKNVFESLPPSQQKEIVRYISNLKSEESVIKNVALAIGYLTGKNRFVGRVPLG